MGYPDFSAISPLDFRYGVDELRPHLSEEGFVRAKLEVELAVAEELASRGICTVEDLEEIRKACSEVTAAEVYDEEKKTRHDIQALVNCIQGRVSDKAKRFVHWMMTSYDVVDTANALRYRRAIKVLRSLLCALHKTVADLAEREAATPMVGRTHGQHAVPTTCGFWLAGFVHRLHRSIMHLESAGNLPGKMSGAVGSFNAMTLVDEIDDPWSFQEAVLGRLQMSPAIITTQTVFVEGTACLFNELVLVMGVLADLANDIRHLQRTEIAEVGEEFAEGQTGSSAMPQKQNPVGFENIVSMWRIVKPTMQMLYDAQVSDHQRDLTSSAASRTYGEMIAYTAYAVKRMTGLMKKLRIDRERMRENLNMTNGFVLAEALRTLLAKYGYPSGHEVVKQLAIHAKGSGMSLYVAAQGRPELRPYLDKMTPKEQALLEDPTLYVGLSEERALAVVRRSREAIGLALAGEDGGI